MNDDHDAPPPIDKATGASDIDPRFDPAAAGGSTEDAPPPDGKSAQQQIDEMAAACSAWVQNKPFQALAVAAGLGFLLGRVGR